MLYVKRVIKLAIISFAIMCIVLSSVGCSKVNTWIEQSTCSHQMVHEPAVPATCTTPGKTALSYCKLCSYRKGGKVVSASHNIVKTDDFIYCDVCGYFDENLYQKTIISEGCTFNPCGKILVYPSNEMFQFLGEGWHGRIMSYILFPGEKLELLGRLSDPIIENKEEEFFTGVYHNSLSHSYFCSAGDDIPESRYIGTGIEPTWFELVSYSTYTYYGDVNLTIYSLK